jgi:hypothetical protein
MTITHSGQGRQRLGTLLVPGSAHVRWSDSTDGTRSGEVRGARFVDRIVWRDTAATTELAGVRSDAECAVETRHTDGTPDRLYLLGATYAEGAGIEHQVMVAGQPFAARYEQGRWSAEQFRTGSTGQG